VKDNTTKESGKKPKRKTRNNEKEIHTESFHNLRKETKDKGSKNEC
jgi:hypothetical protein